MTARTILGCLARQLIQDHPDINALITDIDPDNPLSIDHVSALIEKVSTMPIHSVLDGFDDCSPVTQQDLVSSLQNLQKSIPLLVCIATRVQGDIFINSGAPSIHRLSAHIPVPNPDIDVYISNEVNEQLRLGNLIVRDDRLVEIIKTTLRNQANGMFLWVPLQIVCLSCMENDHDMREALKDLPSGLSETYCRLPKLHDKSRYRRLLFELILVALEPLTLTQLEHALSVEPGITLYNPAKLLNCIDKVIRSCAGMVLVDEEEETARFVHQSARQFLMSPAYDKQIDEYKAQTTVVEIVLTYLNYSLFETRIATRRPATALTIDKLPAAMLKETISFGFKLLQRSKSSTSKGIEPDTVGSRPLSSAEFKGYAEAYWDIHLTCVQPSALCMKMLNETIMKQRLNLRVAHNLLTSIKRAMDSCGTEVLSVLLKQDLDKEDRKKVFKHAAQLNDTDVIDVVVEHYLNHGTEYILVEAITIDCPAMWKALLNYDPVLNRPIFEFNASYEAMGRLTPLMFAIQSRSFRMIETLLECPGVHRSQRSEIMQLTPLEFAVARGSSRAMRLLTSGFIFREWKDHESLWDTALRTLMQATNAKRSAKQFEIIQILVDNGCYNTHLTPDWRPEKVPYGRTPLMVAAGGGLHSVVKLLLDFDDSNVNTQLRCWILVQTGGTMVGPVHIGQPARLPNTITMYRETACELARTPEIKSLLEQHGGKFGPRRRTHHIGGNNTYHA